jgi:hypothetical protein
MQITRRRLLQSALAGMALPAMAVPRALASGETDAAAPVLPAVVDLGSDCTVILPLLKARGVRTVFRYYAPRNEPERGLPDKILTRDEALAIMDAGLSLAVVFQYYSHLLDNMNPVRGRNDAEHAIDYAANVIGQPAGSAIYFAVDNNWYQPAQLARVESYLTAVTEVLAAHDQPYRLGVYGAGRTCRFARDRGLAALSWLAKSTCWAETVDWYNDAEWRLYQSKHNLAVDGTLIDTNLVNPRFADFGQFRLDDAPVAHEERHSRAVLASLGFIAEGTELTARPGGRTVGRLAVADTVRIIARRGDFLLVDVDEDGTAEGYVPAAAVTSIARMPRRCG